MSGLASRVRTAFVCPDSPSCVRTRLRDGRVSPFRARRAGVVSRDRALVGGPPGMHKPRFAPAAAPASGVVPACRSAPGSTSTPFRRTSPHSRGNVPATGQARRRTPNVPEGIRLSTAGGTSDESTKRGRGLRARRGVGVRAQRRLGRVTTDARRAPVVTRRSTPTGARPSPSSVSVADGHGPRTSGGHPPGWFGPPDAVQPPHTARSVGSDHLVLQGFQAKRLATCSIRVTRSRS